MNQLSQNSSKITNIHVFISQYSAQIIPDIGLDLTHNSEIVLI